ncbi:Na(+) H(+) antiporter subunit F [Vibrio ishigakensis]|uniref:Na(+) H(+) antiporter subunit F n=1 Tax=Vibrio ishigakensis TaxID=1481914 RepID=A0A0B8Q661_9VIBR|nr:Na(+) H(+) antiporter subunit F [Vibrio ishigakensis]GAM74046.1 Na(+) H(+) antiporter subunit F [Vibrio ishigakensis]
MYSGQKALLDIAITLGLVAFLGTIAFARYIAKIKDAGEE